jgi:LysR family glycine cleavage system transcriptional activator
MKRNLPSLNALRAFEAAARLASISKAADELSVTHAAVSHQIRGLEDWFEQPLFHREHRRIRLTEAGAELLPVMSDSLDRIAERVGRLRNPDRRTVLTITSAPSIAYRWIVPRLMRFSAEHRGIDIRLQHSMEVIDNLAGSGLDVAIRHGRGGWSGFHETRLLPGYGQPIASPSLLAAHGYGDGDLPLTSRQIAGLPLQHEDTRQFWAGWFAEAGVHDADIEQGAVFDGSGSIIELALSGQACVIGRIALAENEIKSGALKLLSHRKVGADTSYWFLSDAARQDEPAITALRDFLVAEAEAVDLPDIGVDLSPDL